MQFKFALLTVICTVFSAGASPIAAENRRDAAIFAPNVARGVLLIHIRPQGLLTLGCVYHLAVRKDAAIFAPNVARGKSQLLSWSLNGWSQSCVSNVEPSTEFARLDAAIFAPNVARGMFPDRQSRRRSIDENPPQNLLQLA